MEKQRIYFCVDMKSFFASVECAERGLNPFETNLVVADESRGSGTICLAISPGMKAFGVKNRCRLFEIPKNIKYIDAVLVLTPNCSHCEITVAALDSGKHVMCEKPMAINYAEAKRMIEARDRSGKILTIGYQNRYRKDALYLKEYIEEGGLGEIYYAEALAVRRRGVPTWGGYLLIKKNKGADH